MILGPSPSGHTGSPISAPLPTAARLLPSHMAACAARPPALGLAGLCPVLPGPGGVCTKLSLQPRLLLDRLHAHTPEVPGENLIGPAWPRRPINFGGEAVTCHKVRHGGRGPRAGCAVYGVLTPRAARTCFPRGWGQPGLSNPRPLRTALVLLESPQSRPLFPTGPPTARAQLTACPPTWVPGGPWRW